MEGVRRVIAAVEWVAKKEKQRRRVVRQATFAQWPVRGARAILRRHEPLSQCCRCCNCCW